LVTEHPEVVSNLNRSTERVRAHLSGTDFEVLEELTDGTSTSSKFIVNEPLERSGVSQEERLESD